MSNTYEEFYEPNAGQTYIPAEENTFVDAMDFTPVGEPDPLLPIKLEMLPEFTEQGFVGGGPAVQQFLPGVTAEMMDWFWANMEKCYYLWAPGSHKSFRWIKAPWKYGFVHSVHEIVEPQGPVMMRIEISRLDPAKWYPFSECLDHVICEGVVNSKGELNDSTIHMWQDVPGGCVHISTSIRNTRISELPDCIKRLEEKMKAALPAGEKPMGPQFGSPPMDQAGGPPAMPGMPPMPQPGPDGKLNGSQDHASYESSRWQEFLPMMYQLWKGHPDPTQNVQCDLTVRKNENGRYCYIAENPPVYTSVQDA